MSDGGQTLDDDMKAFGIINKAKQKPFQLLRSNVNAVRLAMASMTQMLMSFGGVVGFNYQGVMVVRKMLKLTITKDDFIKFQLLEREIVRILNAQGKTNGRST